MLHFFRRRQSTAVFVEYEYWYMICVKLNGKTPEVKQWCDRLKELYNNPEFYFFADFSEQRFQSEISKIKETGAKLVGVKYEAAYKKQMALFNMLDCIYRKAADKDSPDTFVIVSGNGYLLPVVEYLKGLHKKIVLYGQKNSMNRLLMESVEDIEDIIGADGHRDMLIHMVVDNMEYVRDRNTIIPTFMGTVKAVVSKNRVPQDEVIEVLRYMIEMGYLYREIRDIGQCNVQVLKADWERLFVDGYCKKLRISGK